MQRFTLKVQLFGYWHADSGAGQGARADALIIRDKDGLPLLPGKTLKGLLREGVQIAVDSGHIEPEGPQTLFGHRTTKPTEDEVQLRQGCLTIDNAHLAPPLRDWARAQPADIKQGFTSYQASTSITEEGQKQERSLRVIELAAPVTLIAHGAINADDLSLRSALSLGARLVKHLGSHRSRGLGRCSLSISWHEAEPAQPPSVIDAGSESPGIAPSYRSAWLQIHLKSEVIVSANAATVGGHRCLDYLPGSALLGAAANLWRRAGGAGGRSFAELFFGGTIRFTDALPLLESSNQRCYPTPLSFQTPKGVPLHKGPLHNGVYGPPTANAQYQSIRGNYLSPGGHAVSLATGAHLKTAIDRRTFGRSMDQQFFEYIALPAGLTFSACVSWDTSMDEKAQEILRLLTSRPVRLGRSRSAQFGNVSIQRSATPQQWTGHNDAFAPPDSNPLAAFYCVSDLLLPHSTAGTPGTPNPVDFGFPEDSAHFSPNRSFMRYRHYSPWNSFHQGRETERQVICRGSILSFSLAPGVDANSLCDQARAKTKLGVGELRHEGLGEVILNGSMVTDAAPRFPDRYTLPLAVTNPAPSACPDEPLAAVILDRAAKKESMALALRQGQDLAEKCLRLHKDLEEKRHGKSQWNQIQLLAQRPGSTPEERVELLREWCTKSKRKEYWTKHPKSGPYKTNSLWGLIQSELVSREEQSLMIVHQAAIEVVRRLSEDKSK